MQSPTNDELKAAMTLTHGRAHHTAVLVNEMYMSLRRSAPEKEFPSLFVATPFGEFEVKEVVAHGDWLMALEIVDPEKSKNAILYLSVDQCAFKFESAKTTLNLVNKTIIGFSNPKESTPTSS